MVQNACMSQNNEDFSVAQKLEKYIPKLHIPYEKFITRAVEGVLKSGTVHMTEIGRASREELESASSLKYVKRNLENEHWKDLEVYQYFWKQMSSQFIQPTSVLSIDLGDIAKPGATQMEALAKVWDGSQQDTTQGYSTLEIIGVTEKGKQKPLLLYPFSSTEQGFLSQNRVVETWLQLLFAVIGRQGIITSDRGFLWPEYIRMLSEYATDLVLRLKVDTPLVRYGVSKPVSEWVSEVAFTDKRHFKNAKGQPVWIYMGYLPVQYKDLTRPMYLVVVKCSWLKKPMYMLTTINPRYRGNLRRIRRIYCLRWGIEEYGRFVKQGFELEDVRVRNLYALRRLCLLCVLAFWVLEIIRHGGGALLKRILSLARPQPKQVKFQYYRILKGLQMYLSAFP